MNLRALLVQAEINRRESGRGFLSVTSRFGARQDPLVTQLISASRYGPTLAQMRYYKTDKGPEVRLDWGSAMSQLSGSAVQGIRAKGMSSVVRALAAVTADTEQYLAKELERRSKHLGR
jgi:hypothetical protein